MCRRKNFEKSEEYKRAYGKRDDARAPNSAGGKTNGAQGRSEPEKEGYIQR